MRYLKLFLSGFLGGAADVVPGISGGTVYYILGIYNDLLTALKSLPGIIKACIDTKSLAPARSSPHIVFLLLVLSGVSFAFTTTAPLLVYAMNSLALRPYLYAVFFGLVLGSFFIIMDPLRRSFQNFPVTKRMMLAVLFCIGVMAGAFCDKALDPFAPKSSEKYLVMLSEDAIVRFHLESPATNFNPSTRQLGPLSSDEIALLAAKKVISDTSILIASSTGKSVLYKDVGLANSRFQFFQPHYFLAGAIAVMAMLLPGISGSYMLHVMGMYGPIMSHFLSFLNALTVEHEIDLVSLILLTQVVCGIMLGAYVFSCGVQRLLQKFHDETHTVMSGCLLGSIGILWPFQSTEVIINPYALSRGGYEIHMLERISPFGNGFTLQTIVTVLATLFLSAFFLLYLERKKRSREVALANETT